MIQTKFTIITILVLSCSAWKVKPGMKSTPPTSDSVPDHLDWGWHVSSTNPNIYKNYLSTIKNQHLP